MKKLSLLKLAGAAALVVSGSLVQAQVTTIDPNSAASAPTATRSRCNARTRRSGSAAVASR